MASRRGMAYLMREHEHIPGVFFPVAISWEPDVSEGEKRNKVHLPHYASFTTVGIDAEDQDEDDAGSSLSTETKVHEAQWKELNPQWMPVDVGELALSWKLEVQYLSNPILVKKVSEVGPHTNFEGERWGRRRFLISKEGGRHRYVLVVSAPMLAGEHPDPDFRRALAKLTVETKAWEDAARGDLERMETIVELRAFLLDYFEDNSPAPPDWNSPVFKLVCETDESHGLNRLSMSGYFALRARELYYLSSTEDTPTMEEIREFYETLQRGVQPKALKSKESWVRLLASTPQLVTMLGQASRLRREDKVVPLSKEFGIQNLKDTIKWRKLLYNKEVKVSELLHVASMCNDSVGMVLWQRDSHGEEWVFCVRANHIVAGGWIADEHPEIDFYWPGHFRGASSPKTAVDALSRIWQACEPMNCDLMSVAWAFQFENGQPRRILPLFQRFHKEGMDTARKRLDAGWNLESLELRNRIEPYLLSPKEGDSPTLMMWPEVYGDEGEFSYETERARIEKVLEMAAKSPAIGRKPYDDLLGFFLEEKPHESDNSELGHNIGTGKTTEIVRYYNERFALLLPSENNELVKIAQQASKRLYDTIEDGQVLKASPLSILLVYRLVELSQGQAKTARFREWVAGHGTERSFTDWTSQVTIDEESSGRDHWWHQLAKLLDCLYYHDDPPHERMLAPLRLLVKSEKCFVVGAPMRLFKYGEFVKVVAGERRAGSMTLLSRKLLTILGQRQSSFVSTEKIGEYSGLKVYIVHDSQLPPEIRIEDQSVSWFIVVANESDSQKGSIVEEGVGFWGENNSLEGEQK